MLPFYRLGLASALLSEDAVSVLPEPTRSTQVRNIALTCHDVVEVIHTFHSITSGSRSHRLSPISSSTRSLCDGAHPAGVGRTSASCVRSATQLSCPWFVTCRSSQPSSMVPRAPGIQIHRCHIVLRAAGWFRGNEYPLSLRTMYVYLRHRPG